MLIRLFHLEAELFYVDNILCTLQILIGYLVYLLKTGFKELHIPSDKKKNRRDSTTDF